MCPDLGLNPQPRHMPWLGIESKTVWFTGWCSNPLRHTSQGLLHFLRPELTAIRFLSYFLLCLNKMGFFNLSLRSVVNFGAEFKWFFFLQKQWLGTIQYLTQQMWELSHQPLVLQNKNWKSRESGGERGYMKVYWYLGQGFFIFVQHFWILTWLSDLTCNGFEWSLHEMKVMIWVGGQAHGKSGNAPPLLKYCLILSFQWLSASVAKED